jgi:glyoxylase-like metal-dependent hydrolase (beta-lactamase superfamily II)
MSENRRRGPLEIAEGIYQVGGAQVSHPYDGAVYLLDWDDLVLIDSGVGAGLPMIVRNIEALGHDPARISTLILTHSHIDHIGGAHLFREHLGTRIVIHELDADKLERGDNILTAAFCFNVNFQPLKVDERLRGEKGSFRFGGRDLLWLHTPGHSPGSISLYTDHEGTRILFAQDIMAPLLEGYDCDFPSWRASVDSLLALRADVLCDGHSGVWAPAARVAAYLRHAIRIHEEDQHGGS